MNNHLGKSPNFQKPRPPKPGVPSGHFAISHYAGVVSTHLSKAYVISVFYDKQIANPSLTGILQHQWLVRKEQGPAERHRRRSVQEGYQQTAHRNLRRPPWTIGRTRER